MEGGPGVPSVTCSSQPPGSASCSSALSSPPPPSPLPSTTPPSLDPFCSPEVTHSQVSQTLLRPFLPCVLSFPASPLQSLLPREALPGSPEQPCFHRSLALMEKTAVRKVQVCRCVQRPGACSRGARPRRAQGSVMGRGRGIVRGRSQGAPAWPPGPTGCSLTRLASPTQDRVRHRPSPRGVLGRGDGERLQGGQVSGALLLRGKGMQPAPAPAPTLPGSSRAGLGPDGLPSSPQLPLVHSLEPAMGPKAGGTRITIHGSELHVGSELQVLVNNTEPCTELL